MLGGEQNPSVGNAPDSVEGYWTRTRLDLRDWLQRNSPPLAELYGGAVELMCGIPLPGRVRFISHAIREIRNRLPEVVSGIKTGGRLDYVNSLDEIGRVWVRHELAVAGRRQLLTKLKRQWHCSAVLSNTAIFSIASKTLCGLSHLEKRAFLLGHQSLFEMRRETL